jgi:hypothetical protein
MEIAALWLGVIGLPLSWGKGAAGTEAAWIGAHLSFDLASRSLQVAVQEKRKLEILKMTKGFLEVPTISLKALSEYCGKVNFVAGLVIFLRPFLSWLWHAIGEAKAAANEARGGTNARPPGRRLLPSSRLHAKRIALPLRWLRAFFEGEVGPLSRTFSAVQPKFAPLRVTCDASPWGLGAVLHFNGRAASWLAVQLLPEDGERLGVTVGASEGISVLEALAILIACRTWGSPDCSLEVRSDSAVALAASHRLKSKSSRVLRIVLEASLDLAHERYSVFSTAHIPGVTNVEADALSRLTAPEPVQFPPSLSLVSQAKAADFRDPDFWRVDLPKRPALARIPRPRPRKSSGSQWHRAP